MQVMTSVKFMLAGIVAGAVLVPQYGLSQAVRSANTKKTVARTVCLEAIRESYGATRIADVRIGGRKGSRRLVYGVMDQEGRTGLRFRCWARNNKFQKLEFRARDDSWVLASPVTVDRDKDKTEEAPKTGEQNRLPPAEPQRFKVDWGESYSPEEGVTCYKKRRGCFDKDEKLLIEWTRKEFPPS